jgi:acetyl esterase/lipase
MKITEQPIVYRIPAMDEVTVQRDIEYAAGRTLDVHRPPHGDNLPAVLFVTGFRDAGFEARLGCKQKEMASYVSWARLAAASGCIAITYSNIEPAADSIAVLRYIGENAASLHLDADRIAVWSCSGNVPNALALIIEESVTCAVLCYGFMLDLDGSTAVADAQKQWGFANPAAGKSMDDIRRDLPLLIVRAGRDETAGLNPSIDRFVAHALAQNLPITLINHATAPHSFDLFDDTEATRAIIRQILEFMKNPPASS